MSARRNEHRLCGCAPMLYVGIDAVNERLGQAFAMVALLELCCLEAGDEFEVLNNEIKSAAFGAIQHLIADAHFEANRSIKVTG